MRRNTTRLFPVIGVTVLRRYAAHMGGRRGYWCLLVAGVSGAAAAADVSGGADGVWDAAVAAGVATANELLETQPDPFVKAQQLARSELVLQYEVVRRPVRTAASRTGA